MLKRTLAVLAVLGAALGTQSDPHAQSCANPVVCENALPGSPAGEWDISGNGDPSIQGFATDISVDQGGTVRFKIQSTASAYRLDIYRLGYYAGLGARKVATIRPTIALPQTQPACLTDAATGLIDCGNWAESVSWPVPANAVSGIYIARLVREAGAAGASHIPFIVRDDDGGSNLLFQTSDTTWQAYNEYGGNSLYVGAPAGRAYKVSYNRPFNTRGPNTEDWLFNSEYPMLRWLEANGYDVSYTTDVDTDRRGAELLEHKVYLSVGHDEYWSAGQRANVEAARAAGVHLAFFSGNEIFWKTRWEASIDGSQTAFRTLVTYKETHANAVIDPADPPVWTGTWRDPRFSPPADGGRPENALSGQIFTVNGYESRAIQVPEADGKMRFWRNTTIATLAPGTSATLPVGTLGYEWDEDLDNGSRPAGLVRLSTSTYTVPSRLQDNGSTYASGSATHHLTLYRHSSGALVFGTGSEQWQWGLDVNHDFAGGPVDARMEQATVNLFADMGVQPATLATHLTAATASTDTAAPTSAIASPTAGATLQAGTPITISGTASDTGGVVGAVEVSTDGGVTWHPATGRQTWTYAWTPATTGALTIKSRAADDSGNLETPSAGVGVTVPAPSGGGCNPCSIWAPSAVPDRADPDTGRVEIGTKFRTTVGGTISGVRFYKFSANTGTHVASLWTRTGTSLATATFANETGSGWQQVSFTTPVAIAANTTYIVSYHTDAGRYAVNSRYYQTSGVTNGPLQALADGVDGGDGVYIYSTNTAFPTQTYQSENYWVDVVFNPSGAADATPPAVSAVTPVQGAGGVPAASAVTVTFTEAMDATTINANTIQLRDALGSIVPATVTYTAGTRTATLTPSAALANRTTYTANVRGGSTDPRPKDTAGNALASAVAWSFTTVNGGAPPPPPPPDTTPPTVTSTSPSSGATGVSTTTSVTATFSEAMDAATISGSTVELRTPANALVAASVGYNASTRTATLQPSAALANATTYTATVKGGAADPRAKDAAGNALTANVSWSFTTAAAPPPPPPGGSSIWAATATPAAADADPAAVEVGVKFRADYAGFITALRFYKFSNNGGTHTGHLWTRTGTLLATATFTGESASGWQEVALPSPVAVAANTTYVASYHAPGGHYGVTSQYFASGVDNAPLHGLANGVDGGNGVYAYGASGTFPVNTFNSENYWVDVVFSGTAPPDTTPPTVTATAPAANATGVAVSANVTATFSEAMDASSISTSTVELRDPSNVVVTAIVTYDAATRTATLDPSANLAFLTTYRATIEGGGSGGEGAGGAKDAAGNALAADVTWTFTTNPAPGSCPCSLWSASTVPAGADPDTHAVEIGTKFQADTDGYITALRFYKFAQNTGTHVGDLWTRTGTKLATVTFTNETASGWQQATLPTPVPIAANTTYIAAYHTTVGRYARNSAYWTTGVTASPLRGLANGVDGGNGVYTYGAAGTFPVTTFNSENYWVDVVFTPNVAADTTPPAVTATTPAPGSTGIAADGNVTATFSEALNATTIDATTFELRDPGGALVSATVVYDGANRRATLDPTAGLSYATTYTATVRGAADPRVRDLAGNALAANVSWSFTTAAPPPPPPSDGPGGPILVVTSTGNPYTRYYAEILRAEGLNAFATADLSTVTGTTLAAYDVVILGEMPLTTAQATLFTDWVNGGGNLIAMRPDTKLATLLGLTPLSSTLTNGYLEVDTAAAPGAGIVNQTIQFHGTADVYGLSGATSVADLYSAPLAATPNPAVTVRTAGAGHAAAFTFDLARSIVYTRQGNPAWAGQERDGFVPIRSDDLFFGASSTDFQTDWVNLDKVAIPQGDEQQRLLANLILHVNRARRPLPRFWYFPRGLKAVVVMTGDDHAHGGTAGRFDGYKAASPAGCSVANWECVRGTSYIYPNTPLSNTAAAAYVADGFEVALHVNTNCANWTPASLNTYYTDQLGAFAAAFPGVPAPATHRIHCLVWSDWGTQPQVELSKGIRLDTNYYYWPQSWIADRPGFFTGSGMPMRYVDASGAIVDVYQATTQMTDESGQTFPMTINALLDKAIGPEGYYGAFTANMHTDFNPSAGATGSAAIVASAQARGVPVVAAKQLLQWIDGRNGSSFQTLAWSGSTLTFSVAVGANANGLTAMLPASVAAGTLSALTLDGAPVPFTLQTIKGIEYATFQVAAGAYQATYNP